MNPQVTISPVFDFDKVEYTKANDVHMDIILNAPEKESEKRISLHMILAVDCSGSMSGSKLSSVKDTATKLVKHLTENDTLGMVGFSDDAWQVFPALAMNSSNKTKATEAIDALHSMASTNIEGALRMATEMASTADKGKVKRIVLLTDGLPNIGVDSHEGLVDIVSKMGKTISLSTFGYGVDYNPELLGSMASAGRGNHFYIQGTDDCNKAFALELGGLLSMYGQDIKIGLSMSGNMEVKELLSGYTLESEGSYRGIGDEEFVFTIDDIYTGERKHAVLKVGIPKATKAVLARPTRVCTISVDYLDIETQKRVKVSGQAEIQYVKADEIPSEANQEVREQLMMIEAARIQKEAKEKADAGNFVEAQQVLNAGQQWAVANNWYKNSGQLAQNFASASASSMDAFSYSNTGSKMAVSSELAYRSGRASSGNTIGTSYTSDVQMKMMKSFGTGIDAEEVKPPMPGPTLTIDPNTQKPDVSISTTDGSVPPEVNCDSEDSKSVS